MLSALKRFFSNLRGWLTGTHALVRVDGELRFRRWVELEEGPPILRTVAADGFNFALMYKLRYGPDWHVVNWHAGNNGRTAIIAGYIDGEYIIGKEDYRIIHVGTYRLRKSFNGTFNDLADSGWEGIPAASVPGLFRKVLISFWKDYPSMAFEDVLAWFYHALPVNHYGVKHVYDGIGGIAFELSGVGIWAEAAELKMIQDLPKKDQFVVPTDDLNYTIDKCPVDWHVLKIDTKTHEITFVGKVGDEYYYFIDTAMPGGAIHAADAAQRVAVLGEWEIPKAEVNEIHLLSMAKADEVVDTVNALREDTAIDWETAAESYATRWDAQEMYETPVVHTATRDGWEFTVQVDKHPVGMAIETASFVVPGEPAGLWAYLTFRSIDSEVAGGDPVLFNSPHFYPITSMVQVGEEVVYDRSQAQELVLVDSGWRYSYLDYSCAENEVVGKVDLIRKNPTKKTLMYIEYRRQTGELTRHRLVRPSTVSRAGAANKRTRGKRQRGLGKRR